MNSRIRLSAFALIVVTVMIITASFGPSLLTSELGMFGTTDSREFKLNASICKNGESRVSATLIRVNGKQVMEANYFNRQKGLGVGDMTARQNDEGDV